MAEGAGDGAAKEDRAIQDRAKDLGGKDHGGEEGGSIEDGPDTPSPSFAPTPALTPAPNPARPLAPDHGPASAGADPFGKLSAVLEQGRLDWQLGQAEKALAEQPDDPRRLAVLGEVLTRLGDLDRARACFTRQAELDHGSAAALNNLGGLAMRAGDSREACGLFDAALAIDPDNADARFNRGLCRLRLGAIPEGLADYEARWSAWAIPKPDLGLPEWQGLAAGQDPAGKTILLYTEQGRGDMLQATRGIAALAALGAHPVLICPLEMGRLLASVPGLAGLIPAGAPLPPADYAAPVMSLPHLLGWTVADLARWMPSLAAEPGRVAQWSERLAAESTRRGVTGQPGSPGQPVTRIALAWRGNPNHLMDHERSVPLKLLGAMISALGPGRVVLPVALHPDSLGVEEDRLRAECGVFSPEPDPDWRQDAFVGSAALIAACDMVVTVDTVFAHLAGALGRPAVVLLPADPDWRWGERGLNSPWYPTLALLRRRPQESSQDYALRGREMILAVVEALEQEAARSDQADGVARSEGGVRPEGAAP